jgi:hypothetical protein
MGAVQKVQDAINRRGLPTMFNLFSQYIQQAKNAKVQELCPTQFMKEPILICFRFKKRSVYSVMMPFILKWDKSIMQRFILPLLRSPMLARRSTTSLSGLRKTLAVSENFSFCPSHIFILNCSKQ